MQMKTATWEDVSAYLSSSRVVILPIGSTEQHGPTGLLGTDAICPEHIASIVGERLGILVAPTLNFGQAQQHMGFPGTISLRASTFLSVIRDVVLSLSSHGFQRFYILNGHGGNTHPITTAFAELYSEYSLKGIPAPPIRYRVENWWENPQVKAYAERHFGRAEGYHATASEIAVTQAILPHTRRHKNLPEAPTWVRQYCDAADFKELYPDGRIGSLPTTATPEHGKCLIELMVEYVVKDISSFASAT